MGYQYLNMHFMLPVLLSSLALSCTEGRGVNGGFSCAACTVLFGMTDQLAQIHNETLLVASLRLCEMIPHPLGSYCKEAVETLEPILINVKMSQVFTPDVLCYSLGMCYLDPGHGFCHLFPRPRYNFRHTVQRAEKLVAPVRHKWDRHVTRLNYDLCRLPGIHQLCELIGANWVKMAPAIDLDEDMFSLVEFARGSHWRGRDCRDWDRDSHPGLQPRGGDIDADYNCNGIWGRNPDTGKAFEEELCDSSGARGLIVLGDSVSAHFHFPQAWMNPLLISRETLHNYTGPLLDELDWPQLGYTTGYMNTSEPLLIKGETDSLYLRLRAHNRCNHRDYQNVCRNGASSEDLLQYVRNVARSANSSKPAVVLYAAFGNDVCNSYADTVKHMTTPKRFRQNVLYVLKYLNDTLPPGSHVLLIGLVDGGFIFPTMADRLHPLGQLRGDVRYKDVYRWFTCMEIGPCVGWMTPNATLRNIASQTSVKLNQVLQDLAVSNKFSTFELHYLENPIMQVFSEWRAQGKPIWQLIDPIDSLHPNQKNGEPCRAGLNDDRPTRPPVISISSDR
ncbi:acyloxyacyl hydrolase isoform X2 [Anabrus simplex]|uniref:acyloxyacyl hydrolase isoform X2 n=1 Tax=Anabrus simplex TaxID=316456 RepID=UPI0035A2766E